ncbi:unnamed protein product [Durusdinium trenchii]|uniref:Uncharacterized protein n=2 Tax=Durusdinium trenchii TaxID=1381693 RepID=A0ABP0ID12_9DINO
MSWILALLLLFRASADEATDELQTKTLLEAEDAALHLLQAKGVKQSENVSQVDERSGWELGNCPWINDDWKWHRGTHDDNNQRCVDMCADAESHKGRIQTFGYSSYFCICFGGRVPENRLCGDPPGSKCCKYPR